MRILVTSGPTREWIDAVRFISNASSGRMGYAVASEAVRRGHEVLLVSGPSGVRPPSGIEVVRVETALEMRAAVLDALACSDALVMTAAVADFRPARRIDGKLKKRGKEMLVLRLVRNPDILAEAARVKREGQVFVGFALETDALLEEAKRKMAAKRLDAVVANGPEAMRAKRMNAVLLTADGRVERLSGSKRRIAARIVDFIEEQLEKVC